MAIRLKLDEGPDLLLRASLDEVNRAFQAALDTNEPMIVQTSNGRVAINPHRVLLFEEEPGAQESQQEAEQREPAGAR